MSLQTVVKQLRELPYADMLMLADVLSAQLHTKDIGVLNGRTVADSLSEVANSKIEIETSELSKQEERILQSIFRVKRQIIPQRQKGGWTLCVPTLGGGAQVAGQELRPLWNQMLDQIITLHILNKP